MVERMNYGGYNDDYEDDDEQYDENEAKEIPWYIRANPDYDPEEEERGEASLEEFHEHPEQVDHQLEHAADDIAQLDAEAQFGWRSKSRRSRQGRFVPPDMSIYRWPTFVRVADLQNPDRG